MRCSDVRDKITLSLKRNYAFGSAVYQILMLWSNLEPKFSTVRGVYVNRAEQNVNDVNNRHSWDIIYWPD